MKIRDYEIETTVDVSIDNDVALELIVSDESNSWVLDQLDLDANEIWSFVEDRDLKDELLELLLGESPRKEMLTVTPASDLLAETYRRLCFEDGFVLKLLAVVINFLSKGVTE